MEAFSCQIGAHLCCALSHIDPSTQRQALDLVDILIVHAPQVIMECYQKILPSCIEQISSRQSDHNDKRTLSNAISDSITAPEWRLKVFGRIEGLLRLVATRSSRLDGLGRQQCAANCTDGVAENATRKYLKLYPNVGLHRATGLTLADLYMPKRLVCSASQEFMSQFFTEIAPLLSDLPPEQGAKLATIINLIMNKQNY